jgi:hypothetical protein
MAGWNNKLNFSKKQMKCQGEFKELKPQRNYWVENDKTRAIPSKTETWTGGTGETGKEVLKQHGQ